MERLRGGAAFVTGGGSGIGAATALEIARAGLDVAVCDISASRAEAVAEEVRALGRKAAAIGCDVSDRSSVKEAVAQAKDGLGRISLLCANAGVTSFTTLADMSDDEIDWIYAVDLAGVSHCIRAVLPDMIAAGAGHIVATASMAGLVPSWVPIHVPYTAAKAGVIGMMFNLRSELAEHGVGCTVVCPGSVRTNIQEAPRYRPERFGGPQDARISPPPGFVSTNRATLLSRSPEEVARMTIEAVRDNRILVVTDHTMRGLYEAHVRTVLEAFDASEAFAASEAS